MPQRSYPFAVGRVRVLENKMLDSAKLARMAEAPSVEDAFKLLTESGYGSGANAGANDIEQLIKYELAQARVTVKEITPDEAVSDLFLLHTDAHNLKTLLKSRILETDPSPFLQDGGAFDVAVLQKCVNEHDYRNLPESFKTELNDMESAISREVDPGLMSAAVDRAVFKHIKAVLAKSSQTFVKEYFTAVADFTNVMSTFRARALGYDASRFKPFLVDGGSIQHKVFYESLELPADQLSAKLGVGSFGRAISAALDEYAQTGNSKGFERRMTNARMSILKAGKFDAFSLSPIIGYLIGRETEASAIRLLFAAKRQGVEAELPELYA